MNYNSPNKIFGPYQLEIKRRSQDSKSIDYIGYGKFKNNKKVILGIVKDGTHTRPIDIKMIDFIIDLTVFNNYDIESYRFNKENKL